MGKERKVHQQQGGMIVAETDAYYTVGIDWIDLTTGSESRHDKGAGE